MTHFKMHKYGDHRFLLHSYQEWTLWEADPTHPLMIKGAKYLLFRKSYVAYDTSHFVGAFSSIRKAEQKIFLGGKSLYAGGKNSLNMEEEK